MEWVARQGITDLKKSHIISSLAVVGSIACAAVPAASAATTIRNDTASSANWSGYVAGGTTFSSVSGSWVEPQANCSSGQGYSSYWVGLGGASRGGQQHDGDDGQGHSGQSAHVEHANPH